MDDSSASTLPFDWQLLDRFFAGDCTTEERARILQWTSEHRSRALFLRDLQALGQGQGHSTQSFDVVEAWNELAECITEPLRPANSVPRRSLRGMERLRRQPIGRKVRYVAVSLVVGILGIWVGWQGSLHRIVTQTPQAVSVYTTANGQRANITLLDGTTVALNVASRLEVPANYAAGNRTVRLYGEALFTVSHRDGTPFTVLAGTMKTRVLGTTFLVRQYPTDTLVRVAVRDGKVAVGSAVVTAGQLIDVGRTGLARMGIATPSQFSFAAGVLTLESMPLSMAIPELDRWYNVDIRLGDAALKVKSVEGNVTAGSLADLTGILELTGVRVVRDGRVLTLYQR